MSLMKGTQLISGSNGKTVYVDTVRMSIDPKTGRLSATLSGNIDLTINEKGHLISEVTK